MPDSYPNLKEIEQRPRRYWNADGLPELSMGAVWIVWGIALALPKLLPQGTWLGWYWKSVPVILVVAAFSSQWVAKKLKERITFPRGGYVRWPEPSRTMQVVSALIAALVGLMLVVLVIRGRADGLRNLVAPLSAILIAVAFLVPAIRWKMTHFLVLSIAALALAFIILDRHMNVEPAMTFLLLTLGVIAMVLGSVRLSIYLRRHPAQAEAAS